MNCEHNEAHDKLSFATLKHLTGVLQDALKNAGIEPADKRESICEGFIFQMSYFLDNRWVKMGEQRYRVGLCFQEFATDPFSLNKAIVTDYTDGSMLHEAAIGIANSEFNGAVQSFEQIGEVYEKA
jgi:hypothetical protein